MSYNFVLSAKLLQSCPTLWTVAQQAPLSIAGKNTGVGCHALLQGIFPDPGTKPKSLTSPAVAVRSFAISATWETL